MRFNVCSYLIKEGFKSTFKQKKMTSASIIIMCATMFIFGLFFVIGENVNSVITQLESEQGIQIFIEEDATEQEIETLESQIKSIQGVNKVTFVSKEDALNSMKTTLGDETLFEGWDEENPFPASYFVTLTDLSLNEQVQSEILNLDNVDEIASENTTINRLRSLANGIQITTIIILALLIIISIFIIAYTIKLTVHARRREISIMKYVGATNNFIRGPFIVEGIIIGVISAIITLVILGLAYNAIMPIIYYIYKGGDYKEPYIKNELFKYFIIAQLKQVFGGSSNSTLKDVRKKLVIDEEKFELKNKKFNLKQLEGFSSGRNDFEIDEDEIDNWFKLNKGQYTYLVLSLIREGMDNGMDFHQDHMHPAALLKDNDNFKYYKDKLANIQLIPASKNLRKSKEELKDWIAEDPIQNIPQDCPKDDNGNYIYTESKDFLEFYTARRKILKKKLYKIFGFEYNEKENTDISRDIEM